MAIGQVWKTVQKRHVRGSFNMTDEKTSKLVLTVDRSLKNQLVRAANLSEHKKLVPYAVELLRDGVALDLANKEPEK